MKTLSIKGSLLDADGSDAFSLVHHFRRLARQQGVPMTVVDMIIERAKQSGDKTLEEALSEHLTEEEVEL